MYKLSIIPVILCMTSLAHSEPHLLAFDAYCDETKTIIEALAKKYREIPIAFGDTEDVAKSKMSLWVSPTNKTWSLVSTKGALSCVIGVGNNFEFVPLKPTKQI